MTRWFSSFRDRFSRLASDPGRSALALVLAVLIPRLAWFVFLGGFLPLPVQDQNFYIRSAISVSEGRGLSFSRDITLAKSGRAEETPLAEGWVSNPDYVFGLALVDGPTAVMEPGYPVLLGLLFRLFGPVTGAVWLLNLGFALVGAFAMRSMMKDAGSPAALAGGLLWALYPPYVYYSAYAMTEAAHAALLVLSCAVLFRYGRSLRGALLTGLCAGLFFLVRATAIVLLPIIPMYLGLRRYKASLIVFLGFAVAVSPWVLRNQAVLGSPVMMPTKGSLNLWMRNHPEVLAEEGIIVPASIPVNRPELLEYPSYQRFSGEVERSRELNRSALEFMAANPRLMLWLSWQRAVHFLSPGGSTLGSRAFWAGLAIMIPLAAWGSAGIARSFRSRETRFLAGLFLVYILMHTMAHGGTRYRVPVDMVFIYGLSLSLFMKGKKP